jgi:hypothetical protein
MKRRLKGNKGQAEHAVSQAALHRNHTWSHEAGYEGMYATYSYNRTVNQSAVTLQQCKQHHYGLRCSSFARIIE